MEAAAYDYCDRAIKVNLRAVILPKIFYSYQSDFLGTAPLGEEKQKNYEDRSSSSTSTNSDADECGSDDETPTKRRENPLSTIKWLTSRQARGIAKLLVEGNYDIFYEWDWTPNPCNQ